MACEDMQRPLSCTDGPTVSDGDVKQRHVILFYTPRSWSCAYFAHPGGLFQMQRSLSIYSDPVGRPGSSFLTNQLVPEAVGKKVKAINCQLSTKIHILHSIAREMPASEIIDFNQLQTILLHTFSSDSNARNAAEQAIAQLPKIPHAVSSLLQLFQTLDPLTNRELRQASAIALKNLVSKQWMVKEVDQGYQVRFGYIYVWECMTI